MEVPRLIERSVNIPVSAYSVASRPPELPRRSIMIPFLPENSVSDPQNFSNTGNAKTLNLIYPTSPIDDDVYSRYSGGNLFPNETTLPARARRGIVNSRDWSFSSRHVNVTGVLYLLFKNQLTTASGSTWRISRLFGYVIMVRVTKSSRANPLIFSIMNPGLI